MLHFDRNSVFARFELAGNTICEEVWRVLVRNAIASGKGASSPLSRFAAFI